MSLELWRKRYRSASVSTVSREVVSVQPPDPTDKAPVLCVTGDSRGAAAFADQWLSHIASRGRPAYAVSVRGQGNTPAGDGGRDGKVHDLVQAAAALPRQTVLIGHGQGAVLVAHALTRYPAVAAVLLAPKGLSDSPGAPLGESRVLVAGSPDDRKVSQKALDKAAAAYDTAPLLFSGVGHDFMADSGWQAPLDAIIDWLDEPAEVTV